RLRGRSPVHEGAGPPRGPLGVAPERRQDSREREVRAPEAAQNTRREGGGTRLQRLDELVRVLIALATPVDAAMHDLLQVIAAGGGADLARAHARPRVPLDEHREQLAHLVDVVARLPLRSASRDDLAGSHVRIERVGRDAAPLALVADDAEVPELEASAVADEDVERRQVAVEKLSAVELLEDREDAGDFAARHALRPSLAGRSREEAAEVAVPRVFEDEVVERTALRAGQREAVEEANRTRMVLEELPEVGLADPPVDVGADLDNDDGRHRPGPADPLREIGLAEPARAGEPADTVTQPHLGARDLPSGGEQVRGIGRRRGAQGERRRRAVVSRRCHGGPGDSISAGRPIAEPRASSL